jgi:hypothetical protein
MGPGFNDTGYHPDQENADKKDKDLSPTVSCNDLMVHPVRELIDKCQGIHIQIC